MPSLVLSKRFHFPARPLCLLISSLQRFKRKEKIISGIWNQLKWLLVENASILGSLNTVIKLSLSCCKERFALKLFLRQREIRLFRPERKNLLNPYPQILLPWLFDGLLAVFYLNSGCVFAKLVYAVVHCAALLLKLWSEVGAPPEQGS